MGGTPFRYRGPRQSGEVRPERGLRTYLLNTGEQVLVEASPVDPVWGVSLAEDDPRRAAPGTMAGANLLGFALMKARAILRAETGTP